MRSFTAWVSIVIFISLAAVQPSANGLELPMATKIVIPDAADLSVAPDSIVELYTQLQTKVIVSSNELAMVSLASGQIELARTPTGAKKVARELMESEYDWDLREFGCLKLLWTKESNWNYKARNKSSGAHGIPQALPADKMKSVGTDWRTNPVTQIRWGLRYIDNRYTTPCKALTTFKRTRMY